MQVLSCLQRRCAWVSPSSDDLLTWTSGPNLQVTTDTRGKGRELEPPVVRECCPLALWCKGNPVLQNLFTDRAAGDIHN